MLFDVDLKDIVKNALNYGVLQETLFIVKLSNLTIIYIFYNNLCLFAACQS